MFICFYYLNDSENRDKKELFDLSINIPNLLNGIVSKCFYEVKKSKDSEIIKKSKEIILEYKNSDINKISWHYQYDIKDFANLNLLKNDPNFIKELAKSKFIQKKSSEFFKLLKIEFDKNRGLSDLILSIIQNFIDSNDSSTDENYYSFNEVFEFIIELYNRVLDEEIKEKVIDILDKFLEKDSYRFSLKKLLDDKKN